MSVAALKKIDERAALRSAIADCASEKSAVDRQREAIGRAERLVAENQAKLARAAKAVADAQSEDAKRLASVLAAGGTSLTARAARQARTDEAEAADDVAAARSALASLREDLVEAERDVAVASRAVDAAAAAVLEPTVHRLIEQARAHHARYLQVQAALAEVSGTAGLWTSWDEIRKQADHVSAYNVEADARVGNVSRAEWRAAIAALRLDADAELPPIGGN
jgi:hypothetical protein